MNREEVKREFVGAFAWAGLMLALAAGGVLARNLGYIDRETVQRLVIGVIGLYLAWYGNRMPKVMVSIRVPASARQARRVASWSMVLSGLVYAGLWAFAPIQVAYVGGTVAVVAGIAVTLGYCLTLPAKPKAS